VVAGGENDDHLVSPQEMALKPGIAGQAGRRVRHDRYVEFSPGCAFV
jgi:hypothetical protein